MQKSTLSDCVEMRYTNKQWEYIRLCILWNKNRVKSTACLQRLRCVSGLSAGSPENTERYWLQSAGRVLIGTISKFGLSNIEDLNS